jgi:hypothetical protein
MLWRHSPELNIACDDRLRWLVVATRRDLSQRNRLDGRIMTDFDNTKNTERDPPGRCIQARERKSSVSMPMAWSTLSRPAP